MFKTICRTHRLLTGGLIAIIAFAIATLTAGNAFAAYTVCYTDPVVQLSNGMTITLQAVIDADPTQIASVTYDLHVPVGTTVIGVSYDQYGSLEHLQLIADQHGDSYSVDTTVTMTDGSSAPVSTYALLSDGRQGSANGTTGRTLRITIAGHGAEKGNGLGRPHSHDGGPGDHGGH